MLEIKKYELKFIHYPVNGEIHPIILSDEKFFVNDYAYTPSGDYCRVDVIDRKAGTFKFIVQSDLSFEFNISDCKKVIAKPKEIGYVYNEGPPHDHNSIWCGAYLEDLHMQGFLDRVTFADMNEIYLVVHEVCSSHRGRDCSCKSGFTQVPVLYNGKVILDSYGILENKVGIYKH
jgi:hypothetical protein